MTATQGRDLQGLADWLLYEHEDGRHAVAQTAELAHFTKGDPKWHRVGPVAVSLALPAVPPGPVGGAKARFDEWLVEQDLNGLRKSELASLAFDAGHAFWHERAELEILASAGCVSALPAVPDDPDQFLAWRMSPDCEEACAAIRRHDPTTALREAFNAGRALGRVSAPSGAVVDKGEAYRQWVKHPLYAHCATVTHFDAGWNAGRAAALRPAPQPQPPAQSSDLTYREHMDVLHRISQEYMLDANELIELSDEVTAKDKPQSEYSLPAGLEAAKDGLMNLGVRKEADRPAAEAPAAPVKESLSVAQPEGVASPVPSEIRECNACEWRGPLSETCMLGAVGPLCPECRETTDLASPAPEQAPPVGDAEMLDYIERNRVELTPEFEGPWDAKVYGESETPEAIYSGNTPRAAIRAAMAGGAL